MLNPLMLFGFLGLAAPVLIHMINRHRLPSRPLASLRFLNPGEVANIFAWRPRDLLQLLLRLLLLFLFVLLMVRMTLPADRASDRATIIVLDNSLSMQRRTPVGLSLFELMRRQAAELIEALRESDTAALILVGDRLFSDTGLIRDRLLLHEAVNSAWVSDGGARALLRAIRQAVAELQGNPAPDRTVVVFSDLRRETLMDSGVDPVLQEHLDASGVRLVLIRPSMSLDTDNLAVEQAAFHPSAVHIGVGSKLTALVQNYSGDESIFEVGLSVAAGEGETREIVLEPSGVVHVDLAHRFDLPTDSSASATVRSEDALPGDDRFHVPMRMRQRRQILMVTDAAYQQAGETLERSYAGPDILRYAINPEAALGLPAGVHTAVRRITPAAFAQTTLSMYAAIIVYGVAGFPDETSLRDLNDYVRNGGGLWLIPALAADAAAFNSAFGELAAGLHIGFDRYLETAAFPGHNEAALGHPLLMPLVREEWGNLHEMPVSRLMGLQRTGDARVALMTRDGDWLAAVAPYGMGRVFVQLFDCDMRATAFPRSSAFLPLVQTVLNYLTGDDAIPAADAMRAGDTHYMHFPEFRELGGEVLLSGPTTYRFAVDADGWVRVSDVFLAGNYEVTHTGLPGRRARMLSVNPVRGESDLTQADDALLTEVFGETQVEWVPFESLAEGYTYRSEIWQWLLALVMVALLVESLAGAWQTARRREVVRT